MYPLKLQCEITRFIKVIKSSLRLCSQECSLAQADIVLYSPPQTTVQKQYTPILCKTLGFPSFSSSVLLRHAQGTPPPEIWNGVDWRALIKSYPPNIGKLRGFFSFGGATFKVSLKKKCQQKFYFKTKI